MATIDHIGYSIKLISPNISDFGRLYLLDEFLLLLDCGLELLNLLADVLLLTADDGHPSHVLVLDLLGYDVLQAHFVALEVEIVDVKDVVPELMEVETVVGLNVLVLLL